ncbi:serine phosphatase RsbU, regulator of sigma subunit [Anaerolinea thermolimosa]|uniref:GAF domain-containing protein n=1 Tax=Anaerolinea thermolimosa TaxID=229919 RepID=UPI0007817230|nr:GAF domain-containing protein [Anaerolinea thermolimosa]GAP07651.1 serine phosphatase RsbU, regulator of sigma subunit [Anaerolinea thermolimosa]
MIPLNPSRPSREPEWKQFLRLGEQLIRQSLTSAQCQLVEETVSQMLGGSAHLWLARPFYPLPGETDGLDLLPSSPAPDMVYRAQLEREIFLSDGEQIVPLSQASALSGWMVAIPLLANENLLGVLLHQRSEKQPFHAVDLEFLEGLASHAATALEISRQQKLNRWRLEQLSLVRKVSAQIADVLDLDELCNRVTELIARTFHYYYVAIFTATGDPPVLEFRAAASQTENRLSLAGMRIQPGEGLIGTAFSTGKQVVVPDVLIDPRFRFLDALPETLSEAAFPLKIEKRVLGVLDVQSDTLDDFHEIDILVLSALADNVALAVQAAWLYTDLERRASQLSTVAEISQVLGSILELDQLLTEVVHLIQRRFGYSHVSIFSVHEGRRLIFFQAGSGERSAAMYETELAYSLDAPTGIIPWVARNGRSMLVNDVLNEPLYQPSPLPPENTRAELAVPILYGQQVLGVLDIQSEQPGAFTDADRTLFETLASTIGISYRNATLYRSERWRRQVAESFRDVANQMTSGVDLPTLLNTILERLENNLPCEASAIWLLDEHDNGEAPHQHMRLAAARGVDSQQLNRVLNEKPETAAFLNRVLQLGQPYIRTTEDPPDPLGSALGFESHYSSLTVPMVSDNRVVGLLSLAHHTFGRYGSEASSMTATFASYAGVAIQNIRLYNEAQDQAWVATMLVQVAEASQSVLTVDDLLATMLRLTRLLVGVRKCAFLLKVENRPYFELKSWYGFEPGINSSPFYPATLPALARLSENRSMLTLFDPAVELALPEFCLNGGASLYIMLPLLLRGDLTGAFLVAIENEPSSAHQEPHLEPKAHAILQGIAHQTSITVENLRLLEARQEEAYVTAALLQVAQAVVSTRELSEVLENIVHLLPILVGIDVCLIYRWDEDLQIFRPTNVHGENRRQEYFLLDNIYLPGEHRLLDAVFKRGQAHICPMSEVGLPAEDWPMLPCMPLEEYLQSAHQAEGDWLLGFPLIAQEQILGVLIVRERNQSTAFRERRLEILNGIAQQTSLAIQNDLYRRELLQNERVEQEIQLARQIQETFLPDHIPSIPGWEISIRWQTARQVGGDFYDVFELKDGRVGLVVADVSDKGLAAALYMTVARTLIRASVRDHADPTEVLDEVNTLLFTESPESMFITAIYAVLNPQTGELVYANAGHNLPFLYRASTGEVEQLSKGGMAMGVLPDLPIENHRLFMQAGDCLLLYTDGACDTLSPAGEDFGEARLREVVHATGGKPADELLSEIDRAISAFRQNTPLSDDITLVAVRRTP